MRVSNLLKYSLPVIGFIRELGAFITSGFLVIIDTVAAGIIIGLDSFLLSGFVKEVDSFVFLGLLIRYDMS